MCTTNMEVITCAAFHTLRKHKVSKFQEYSCQRRREQAAATEQQRTADDGHGALEAGRLQQQQLKADRYRLRNQPEAQQEVEKRQAEATRLLVYNLRTRLIEAEQHAMVAAETAARAARDASVRQKESSDRVLLDFKRDARHTEEGLRDELDKHKQCARRHQDTAIGIWPFLCLLPLFAWIYSQRAPL